MPQRTTGAPGQRPFQGRTTRTVPPAGRITGGLYIYLVLTFAGGGGRLAGSSGEGAAGIGRRWFFDILKLRRAAPGFRFWAGLGQGGPIWHGVPCPAQAGGRRGDNVPLNPLGGDEY